LLLILSYGDRSDWRGTPPLEAVVSYRWRPELQVRLAGLVRLAVGRTGSRTCCCHA